MTDPKMKPEQLTKARSMENALRKYAPVQMSFWHDEARAIANELARCALISCRDVRKPRAHYHNEQLFVLGKDAAITYTGEELRGYDEDVFLTLAHLAREQPDKRLLARASSAQICRLNGWPARQSYYTEIYKSVQRLSAATLTIYSRRLTRMRDYERVRASGASKEELARLYDELQAAHEQPAPLAKISGTMLSMVGSKVSFTGGTSVVDDFPQGNLDWEIPLEPEMVSLFAAPFLTLVPFMIRRDLSTGARRLQAYYMSHREPFPILLSNLGKLLNLDCPLKEQKRIVSKCLRELLDKGVLAEATLDEGRGDVLVRVVRTDPPGMENDTPSA